MKKTTVLVVLSVLAAVIAALPAGALYYPADVELNASPVAENLELVTFRSIPVSGEFKCMDPEGDQVTYSLVRQPKKGEVVIDGATFTYTPAEGKKGKDTFTYAAVDSAGNVSNEATVTVQIRKQKTSVTYSDMTSNPDAYAATVLAEKGVFVGERVGGEYLFHPEETVTRGEFLVMCMSATGAELLNVTRTGFSDDEAIPLWQKPWVTTALTCDLISGSALPDGSIVFSPDEPITFAQASVIVNNAVGITDVTVEDAGEAAPAWALQASANLSSCKILPSLNHGVSAAPVTRADAARILLGAIEVMEARQGDGLLGWLDS